MVTAVVAATIACSPGEAPRTTQGNQPPAKVEASPSPPAPPPVPVDTALARLRSSSPSARRTAAYNLAAPGPRVEERVQALARALRDPDPGVGHAAASSLGNIGAPSLPLLVKALADPRPTVRALGLYGLGKMGRQAMPARDAIRGALTDPDRSVRDMASWTAGQIEPKGVTAALGTTADLAAGLASQVPEERLSALRRFQPFVSDSDRAMRLLIRTLGDADPRVRGAAGDALVTLGSPAVRAALTAALSDSNPVVRREASVALVRLGPR